MPSAYDDALRLLARRLLSRRELTAKLAAKGHDAESIDDALGRIAATYGLDDGAVVAERVRARGADRGRERIVAELAARGIDGAAAEAAWDEAVQEGHIDPDATLARAVRKRLGEPPGHASRARLARVYNALLSEGFRETAVLGALAPYGLERDHP